MFQLSNSGTTSKTVSRPIVALFIVDIPSNNTLRYWIPEKGYGYFTIAAQQVYPTSNTSSTYVFKQSIGSSSYEHTYSLSADRKTITCSRALAAGFSYVLY